MGQAWIYFMEGQPFSSALALSAGVVVVVLIERWLVFRRAKVVVNELLAKVRKALIVNRSIRDAIKVCEQYRSPLAYILKAGLLKYGQPRDDVEQTIRTAAIFEIGRLERRLLVLSTCATAAPLVGIASAFLGMALTYLEVADGTALAAVARELGFALIDAVVGIGIALPAQIGYNHFVGRVKAVARDVETSSNLLLETFGEMERSGVSTGQAAA